ncbi:MAG: sulfotransferase family 2 domain-containing protein, partial [Gemmatimonadetes bacterium]|nr:sulfotransferase family 2 domain-containing protein [Gemmatimonadota bacterium]
MSYCITNPRAGYGYCYVNVAKAGCTSIKLAIAEHLGVPFDVVQWRYPYRQRSEYAVEARDLFRFSVVRHPAARLVSCWADWCCEPYPAAGNYEYN